MQGFLQCEKAEVVKKCKSGKCQMFVHRRKKQKLRKLVFLFELLPKLHLYDFICGSEALSFPESEKITQRISSGLSKWG